jgi:Holliday junction resolvasome RuvABC DNA-binding subunit
VNPQAEAVVFEQFTRAILRHKDMEKAINEFKMAKKRVQEMAERRDESLEVIKKLGFDYEQAAEICKSVKDSGNSTNYDDFAQRFIQMEDS